MTLSVVQVAEREKIPASLSPACCRCRYRCRNVEDEAGIVVVGIVVVVAAAGRGHCCYKYCR